MSISCQVIPPDRRLWGRYDFNTHQLDALASIRFWVEKVMHTFLHFFTGSIVGSKSNAPRFVTFWDLPLSQGKKVIPTLLLESGTHTVPIINNKENICPN